MIVGKRTITMQFLEIIDNVPDVIEGVGAQRVPRKLRDMPWTQIREYRLGQ